MAMLMRHLSIVVGRLGSSEQLPMITRSADPRKRYVGRLPRSSDGSRWMIRQPRQKRHCRYHLKHHAPDHAIRNNANDAEYSASSTP
ncbi:hypothetical protein ACU4GI_32155 [Cupriavidus basilensis]